MKNKTEKGLRGVPAVDMPREKLQRKGVKSLSDTDLLALILRSGIRGKNAIQLARDILKRFKLCGLSQISCDELKEIPGMGLSRACSIIAAFELNNRLLKEKKDMRPVLDNPEKIYFYISEIWNAPKEKFIAVYFNTALKVISKNHISIGTLSSSVVHPRDVFKPALELNAHSIAIVHNHPSGILKPSEDDIRITEKLKKAGEIMGIELIDHLIVTSNSYFSFKEKKML
ncbi:MAG: RadC family protein [Elusimicrobiota bacterium]